MKLTEPLVGLFTHSRLLVLDFAKIPPDTPPSQSMQSFFERTQAAGKDPRSPENRQSFNDQLLRKSGSRYLVSQYGEDRSAMLQGSSIAAEGRILHLGIDIFCQDLEVVYAPCTGRIVRVGQEQDAHSFGHYCVLQPEGETFYIFLGHLAKPLLQPGIVQAGQTIGRLGDFHGNENGGWSRHLHLQLLSSLPLKSKAPIGYSSVRDFHVNQQQYPDPMQLFPEWRLL